MRIRFPLLLAAAGCSAEPITPDIEPNNDDSGEDAAGAVVINDAIDAFMEEGVTCETSAMFASLTGIEKELVIEGLRGLLVNEGPDHLVKLGGGCLYEDADGEDNAETSDPIPPPITGTYTVEFIEESSSTSGTAPRGIYRDSSSSAWMCNSGSPATTLDPADFIALTNVSGAYSNRSSLRVRGTNIWAKCYLPSSAAARVYSDNDIAMCIGYWSVTLCGALVPLTSDIRTWR